MNQHDAMHWLAGLTLAAALTAQARQLVPPSAAPDRIVFDDQAGTLALHLTSAPLARVLQALDDQYGLVVRATDDRDRQVTLDVHLPFHDAMRALLGEAPYCLEVRGRDLVLAAPSVAGKPSASLPDHTKPGGGPGDATPGHLHGMRKDLTATPQPASLSALMTPGAARPTPMVTKIGGKHARLELHVTSAGVVRVGMMVEVEGPLVQNDYRSGTFVSVVQEADAAPVLGAMVDPFEVRPMHDGFVRDARRLRLAPPDEVTVWLPLPERFLQRDVLARTQVELRRISGDDAPLRLSAETLPALRAASRVAGTVGNTSLSQVVIEKR